MSHNRLCSAITITSIPRLPEYVHSGESARGSRDVRDNGAALEPRTRKCEENETLCWNFFHCCTCLLSMVWVKARYKDGYSEVRITVALRPDRIQQNRVRPLSPLYSLQNGGREGAIGPRDGSNPFISSSKVFILYVVPVYEWIRLSTADTSVQRDTIVACSSSTLTSGCPSCRRPIRVMWGACHGCPVVRPSLPGTTKVTDENWKSMRTENRDHSKSLGWILEVYVLYVLGTMLATKFDPLDQWIWTFLESRTLSESDESHETSLPANIHISLCMQYA